MNIRGILRWPLFITRAALQHPPAPHDDEIAFWEAYRYLDDLADTVQQEAVLARYELGDYYTDYVVKPLLEMLDIPVESTTFWETWDWPEDHARMLLDLWRHDNDMNKWLMELDTTGLA